MKIKGLSQFPKVELPKDPKTQKEVFCLGDINKIICFVLGPEGTNMVQACRQWILDMEVSSKTEIVLCRTPEKAVEQAKAIKEEGNIGVFWTCAVYYDLHKLFFQNSDTLPFFIEVVMSLDEMQLATRIGKESEIKNGAIPSEWTISSHPSPEPLIQDLGCKIDLTTSNAQAAKNCARGKADACITTESARKEYGLQTLHKFGSPDMVFFGGITEHGTKVIKKAYDKLS